MIQEPITNYDKLRLTNFFHFFKFKSNTSQEDKKKFLLNPPKI